MDSDGLAVLSKTRAWLMIFVASVIMLSHPARADDLISCLQSHPDSCSRPIYQFQILPADQQAGQLPALMDIMQGGLTGKQSVTAVRAASYAIAGNRSEARMYIPMLVQFFNLDDTHENLRESARRALAGMGPDALPNLVSVLNQGNQRVSINVIKTLGQLRGSSDEILSTLVNLLDYPDPLIRQTAESALYERGTAGRAELLKWQAQHPSTSSAAVSPPDSATQLEALIAQTNSSEALTRDNAVMNLVRWEVGQLQPGQSALDFEGTTRAESAIIDRLHDSDERVRADAVYGTLYFKRYTVSVRDYYQDALKDPSEKVRARGILGMSKLQPSDPGFEQQLEDLLDKELTAHPEEFLNGTNEDSVYAQGINALRHIGTPTAKAQADQLMQEFNTRYGDKRREDHDRSVAEARGDLNVIRIPRWGTVVIGGLLFLWVAFYWIRFPPTTTLRVMVWMVLAIVIGWRGYRFVQHRNELKANSVRANPAVAVPQGLITF